MDALVGCTGFVGTNLCLCHEFDLKYNSKNINEAYGKSPDLLVYAGIRSEKFLANNDPLADMANIEQAFENIKKIAPKKLVHISTVDVFKKAVGVTEKSVVDTNGLNAYGLNRYILEQKLRAEFPECHIIRLPGLYGAGLKKNFIYDLINIVPSMIKSGKFDELDGNFLKEFYSLEPNGFYKCREIEKEEKDILKKYFLEKGFSALNFTDSRATFQFYNLAFLWNHILKIIENDLKLVNISTAPITAAEIYKSVRGENFVNILSNNPPQYDYKTEFAEVLGGVDGYLFDAKFVKKDIKKYIEDNI